MNAKQYRAHCEALGMTQLGASRFLDISPRTSRRFAAGEGIPRAVDLLLRIMVTKKITPQDALRLAGIKPPREGFGDRRVKEADDD